MSAKPRLIPVVPVWQPLLRHPTWATRRHLSGELAREADSLDRRVSAATIPPSACILPVINRQHPPATSVSRRRRHTLHVSSTPSLASDAQHDLAEMGVGAHMRLRRGRLVEREDAVDRQMKLPRLDQRPEIRAHPAIDLAHLVERAGAEGDADVVDALQRVEIEIEGAGGAAEPADIDDAAAHLDR